MELRKQGIIFHRRRCHALPEPGKRLRCMPYAGFILRGNKKGAEKRTVDAVAEGEPGVLQALQKFLRKIRPLLEQRPEKSIPGFNRVLAGFWSEARHHRFAFPDGADWAA